MSLQGIFDILGALVGVALVTTIVAHPNTAADITAAGNAFNGALHAAQGM
jgi:hypothetical protein